MFKRLAVLTALAFGSVCAAHATPITGTISLFGSDTFTSSTVTFGTAFVFGGSGANTGTFGFLPDLTPVIMFPGFVPPLPYAQGPNTVPANISPVEVFTTTVAGKTVDFFMTTYDAMFTDNTTGCLVQTCLDVTGSGFFTVTGFDNTPGEFVFTTQLAPGQTTTTFSASGFAVPEPATLALVGAGLLGMAGIAGFARRKFSL